MPVKTNTVKKKVLLLCVIVFVTVVHIWIFGICAYKLSVKIRGSNVVMVMVIF